VHTSAGAVDGFEGLALIDACVHLIREDERIAAGQVTLTGALLTRRA
jgi:hypothetical protein